MANVLYCNKGTIMIITFADKIERKTRMIGTALVFDPQTIQLGT